MIVENEFNPTTVKLADTQLEQSVTWILYLECVSESLGPGHYLSPYHGRPLIEWTLDQLKGSRFLEGVIVVHSRAQRDEFANLDIGNFRIVTAQSGLMTDAVCEVARRESMSHVALISVASPLMEVELLDEMIEQHLSMNNDLTWARGITVGVSPWVISRRLLERVADLTFSWLPKHPGLACQKLRAAVAEKVLPSMPFEMRELAFDCLSRFGVSATDLPLSISLNRPGSMAVMMEVLESQLEARSKGLSALVRWKIVEIRKNEELFGLGQAKRIVGRVSSPKRRILYIASRCAYSGAEESLVQLVRRLDSEQFEKYVLLGSTGRLHEELVKAGAVVEICEDLPSVSKPLFSSFANIKRTFRRINPSIVHLNGIEGAQVMWNALELSIPIVLHVRNGDMSTYKEQAEAASALISVSQFLSDRVLRFSIAKHRSHVIYDEADVHWFRPGVYDRATTRKSFGIPEDALVVALIARFVPNKRHDLMLAAFEIVSRKSPCAVLLLKGDAYGSDPTYDQIAAKIHGSPFRRRIVHITWVRDIREVHAAADVVVLCSDQEGLGRCIVEAMAMGVPTVVTDTGGTHEIVEHDVSGFVVPGNSPEALAEAICTLLADASLRQRFGHAARQHAKEQLDSSISATRVAGIYKTLC